MTVRHPGPVPELAAEPGARSVVSGVRACAVVVSDVGDTMRRHAAPDGLEGDPADIARHAMTSTARDVEAATAALQLGLAALDAYCDVMDDLRADRTQLVSRHHALRSAARALEARVAAGTPDATLAGDVHDHAVRVGTFDGDVDAWSRRVARAEDRLVAALHRSDTTTEARGLVTSAPDVPALVHEVERLGRDPVAVLAWWRALSRAEREALKVARPEFVGNLDGVPVVERDEANRANLSALHNTLKQVMADGETTAEVEDLYEKTSAVYRGLTKADGQLEGGLPVPVFLMVFDPDAAHGDGHAAIAFGNPETADHVSVNVPGLTSTMGNIDGVAGDAARVREMAARLTDGTVASIAWLGYDAPDFDPSLDGVRDVARVTGEGSAAEGARSLSDFVDGLRATRQGDPPHYTVIGHSYGSVAVAKAAGGDLHVDDVVLVGSPGVGDENHRASDLHGRVYVGSSDQDFVTHLGGDDDRLLGVDPAGNGFGGTRFRVDPQGDFDLTVDGLGRGVENHTSYFDDRARMAAEDRGDQDSASLVNVGRVVSGHGSDVESVGGRTESNDTWWVKQGADDAGRAAHNWFERHILRRGD